MKYLRFVALILLIAMLSACAPAPVEEFDVDFTSVDDNGVSLEGFEMTYEFGVGSSGGVAYESVLGYDYNTPFSDLAAQRLSDVEKNLNCKVNINYREKGASCGLFVLASASGYFLCDAALGISDMWTDIARTGMLIGLSELDGFIDYRNEDKWGQRPLLEVVYYNDDLYGVAPVLWPELIQCTFGSPIVVCEDLIAEMGATDPRDYVENKEWTWAKFRECLEDYYLDEGGEVKHYSLTCGSGDFGNMFVRTNGDRYAEKDASGNYTLGFYSDSAVKAMNEAYDIYYGTLGNNIDKTGSTIDSIVNATSVMAPIHSYNIIGQAGDISKQVENFGIIPWPYGPDVEPGYTFGMHSNIEMCISFSRMSSNPEATATIIDAIYEPFEGYENVDKLKDFMSHNYFFDPRDCDVFYDMFLNTEYNYFHFGMHSIVSAFMDPTKTVTQALEERRSQAQDMLTDTVLPSINGIIALWGDYQ